MRSSAHLTVCSLTSDVNSKKKKSLGCCKCCLFLFTSLSVIVIAIGILGNIQAHTGLVKVRTSSAFPALTQPTA